MNLHSCRNLLQRLIPIIITGVVWTFCPLTAGSAATAGGGQAPGLKKSRPGPVSLAVNGASAGITTEYFEQALAEAISARKIFSGIDRSRVATVVMLMPGASSTISSIQDSDSAPYALDIRIVKVSTPSFGRRMTVTMKAIWDLYRIPGKASLLHETVNSTYTGKAFEGGLIGANRVRVAMEGAARENIRIGVGLLESLDFGDE